MPLAGPVVAGEEIHGRDALFRSVYQKPPLPSEIQKLLHHPDGGPAAHGLSRGLGEVRDKPLSEKCGVGIDESPIHSLLLLRDASLPFLAEWSGVKCLTPVVRGILRGCFPIAEVSRKSG